MILGQPLVNRPPVYGPKPGMMNDSGMAPSLGALARPEPMGHGGGLVRLMALYGRPGRALGNPYGTPAY